MQVHSDHHEVVADLVQTSFLFSIPMDGPMSFSTRHVSVQWSLRFEFFTTPKNIDWTRYAYFLPTLELFVAKTFYCSNNEQKDLSLGNLSKYFLESRIIGKEYLESRGAYSSDWMGLLLKPKPI